MLLLLNCSNRNAEIVPVSVSTTHLRDRPRETGSARGSIRTQRLKPDSASLYVSPGKVVGP